MLPFYAAQFPLAELNFTYYQMPTKQQLAKMAQRVPRDFQFIVKAHQSITHDMVDSAIAKFAESLEPLRASRQLLNVLCQFPQRLHWSSANQQWITNVQKRLNGAPLAFEFRHHSWDRAGVYDWLNDAKITPVSVDVPPIAALFPRKLLHTGDTIYLRLHSRRAESWYGEGAERYDYLYSEQEMSEWIDALDKVKEKARRAMVLFNNCRRANAVINAQQMADLLVRRGFALVEPPTSSSAQPLLF